MPADTSEPQVAFILDMHDLESRIQVASPAWIVARRRSAPDTIMEVTYDHDLYVKSPDDFFARYAPPQERISALIKEASDAEYALLQEDIAFRDRYMAASPKEKKRIAEQDAERYIDMEDEVGLDVYMNSTRAAVAHVAWKYTEPEERFLVKHPSDHLDYLGFLTDLEMMRASLQRINTTALQRTDVRRKTAVMIHGDVDPLILTPEAIRALNRRPR